MWSDHFSHGQSYVAGVVMLTQSPSAVSDITKKKKKIKVLCKIFVVWKFEISIFIHFNILINLSRGLLEKIV